VEQETALVKAAQSRVEFPPPAIAGGTAPPAPEPPELPADSPIWNRAPHPTAVPAVGQTIDAIPPSAPRKRGPKPDAENHAKVASIIRAYGENWTSDDSLVEICDELDRQKVPVPKTWLMRPEGPARSWSRGRQNYPHLVIKAIKDRYKAAMTATAGLD
jgi:hypothetical protein